jgi:tripartite-type tricarboxylate transporter receptor subunit TctC
MSSRRFAAIRGTAAVLGALAALPGGGDGTAQAQVYAGKQIRMVIASGAGGGYDTYGRLMTRHMGKYIPGNPTFVTQNMQGASGITATNWTYTVAPKDGTVMLATYNAIMAEPLYGNPAARFDPRKFESVGSISKQQNICATWHTSPIKTIQDAKTREVTVASTGATGNSATLPKILNTILGTKFKLILGYSTTEARLAVERGEVDGICGLSYSTLKASNPDWIINKRINVLLQTGAKAQAGLETVPVLVDLVPNADDKKVIELISFPEEIGRPFVMPPGTPKEMVTLVRRAFDAALKDPALLAEAEKTMLEVDPVTGEEMEQLLIRAYDTPKPLVQRAIELGGSGAPQ